MDSTPITGSKSGPSSLDVEDLLDKLELDEKIALLSGEQLPSEPCRFLAAIVDFA